MSETQNTIKKKRDRIGMILYVFYLIMLVLSVVLIGKIIYMQMIWRPDEKIYGPLTPKTSRQIIEPVRGNILDCNGRVLAMTYPVYDLHMDCTVGKEADWQSQVGDLAKGLSQVLKTKSSGDFLSMIKAGRRDKKRYLEIGTSVDRKTLNKIKELPLYREGRNKGGLIISQRNTRRYPYGELARRTIGFVRGSNPGVSNNLVGIEGKFNDILHGKDGREWFRQTDKGKLVQNFDSTYVKPVDGRDVTTTLNIDYQEMADKALRAQVESETDIDGATLVLMEVSTGAIRAMVNLKRDPKTGRYEESENMAVGRRHEPGSVFKTVTLMSVLEDGRINSLEDMLPTEKGLIPSARVNDQHIRDYERENHTTSISVLEGFKISSNYVFAKLALDNYGGRRSDKFMRHIHEYGLDKAFEFDLDGMKNPNLPDPKSSVDLARMGYGYATELCPIQILAFYNAIAGKGRLMKPYLVNGPEVLDASICSKAVADTLTRALKAVTEDGTAKWSLRGCKTSVAGKTGTSFGTFLSGERGADPYQDAYHRRKYQGTFVGFFPAEDPQYTVISNVYSNPTIKSYQGGGIPARAVKALIDDIYTIDPYWQKPLKECNSDN